MNQKLYYKDAYMQTFTADLISERKDEAGRTYALLSQTAFYPTGGGQPSDIGTLNGVRVVEVEEIDGEIRHYIDGSLKDEVCVEGRINWSRRFDHMQQHTGQHILSAAFDRLFHYKTVSFHLGSETLTIDLATEHLSLDEAAAAERLANEVILENRPIECTWISEEEIGKYQLRKELAVQENIRLVIIPEFDDNGCGGTHPSSTGQVSALKILGWEKQKKNVRVEFICGNRIREQFGRKHSLLKQLSSLLNAPEQGMEEAVERLLNQRKDLEKSLEEAKEKLLTYEAKELIEQNEGEVIRAVFEERSIQELQKLGKTLVSIADKKVVLLAAENGDKLQFVFAKGKEAEGNMKELSKSALAKIEGKGGGSESFAQGGGDLLVRGEEFLLTVHNMLGM